MLMENFSLAMFGGLTFRLIVLTKSTGSSYFFETTETSPPRLEISQDKQLLPWKCPEKL